MSSPYVNPGRQGRNLEQFAEQIDHNVQRAFTSIYGITQAERDAKITPADFRYPEGDVRRYGAVGDGSTDCTTAIQNAFTVDRTDVYFPPGTYKITDSNQDGTPVLTSSVADRRIYGPGVITATAKCLVALKVTGARSSIQINVDGNEVIAEALHVAAADCLVEDCVIRDLKATDYSSTGIFIDLDGITGGATVSRNRILGVNSVGDGSAGNADGMARGIAVGADANQTDAVVITGNYIRSVIGEEGDCITCVNSDGAGTYFTMPLFITNNTIVTWTRRAIKIQCNGSRVLNNSLRNTYSSSAEVPNIQHAIAFIQGTNHSAVGNHLVNCKFAGQINVNADTETVDDIIIKNNLIEGIGSETTNTILFFDLNGSRLDISGNVILCPNFASEVITINRVDYGSVINNTIYVDEAGGATPFREVSSTNIVEFGNTHGTALRVEGEVFTVDHENRAIGINTGWQSTTPDTVLDIYVDGNESHAIRLKRADSTISDGEIVSKIEFHQNDNSSDAVVASIKAVAEGSTGSLALAFQTGSVASPEVEALRVDVNGNTVPGADDTFDLGTASKRWQDGRFAGVLYVGSYTVATLPSATTAAGMIYVSDETGGAVMAFSDGTNWRRVTDRAIVA